MNFIPPSLKKMFWDNIKKHSKSDFKRLTGVEIKTFKLMVKQVNLHDSKIAKRKGNARSRPFDLIVEDQILMTLMYYREYRTQFHIGETYGLHESNVCRNIKRIEDILKKCESFKLPGKEKLAGTNHQFQVILIDATESPIERPKKSNTYITQEKRRSTR
jgi:Helix-turn-helix of DDE superfamily endonuclease